MTNLTVTFRELTEKQVQDLEKAIPKLMEELDIDSSGFDIGDFDIHPISPCDKED